MLLSKYCQTVTSSFVMSVVALSRFFAIIELVLLWCVRVSCLHVCARNVRNTNARAQMHLLKQAHSGLLLRCLSRSAIHLPDLFLLGGQAVWRIIHNV